MAPPRKGACTCVGSSPAFRSGTVRAYLARLHCLAMRLGSRLVESVGFLTAGVLLLQTAAGCEADAAG